MQLSITKTENPKTRPQDTELTFGTDFSDHLFNMNYTAAEGWHHPRIEPYAPINLDPATAVLHYGQAVFEGLKAYRTTDGNIQLFRPKDNFKRMNRSCRALCIPEFDEAFVFDALKELLRIDADWVPSAPETSLYIRPTIIATDPYLGVRSSYTYLYYIILSPVGVYYPEGFNPVKIMITKDHVRAVRGGLGEAKTAANYAASLNAGEAAQKEGYTQVLWLDGIEQNYIEEVGSMNIFFVIDDEIITPELNGSILPGITRDSVIKLAAMWDLKVTERKIGIDEILEAHASETLQEIFGTGTAAVISPVGELKFDDTVITVADGSVGPLSNRFYQTLTDIQYGKSEDPIGWIEKL